MLIAHGAGDTWRSPLVRAMFRPFIAYTRRVYQRLARDVAAEIADYHNSGLEPVGVIGIAGQLKPQSVGCPRGRCRLSTLCARTSRLLRWPPHKSRERIRASRLLATDP
jgi:hypothetical protein